MLERPYIDYADNECSRIPTNDANNVAKHVATSACFYFVNTCDHPQNSMWSHDGEDSVYELIIELSAQTDQCIEKMKQNQEMAMTEDDKSDFDNATCCHICNGGFGEQDQRVRAHDHRTGCDRGAAHNRCNIDYFANRFLPMIFHNLKGYASHLITKQASERNNKLGNMKIDAIPNAYEQFMTFSIGDLKFIDSFRFMASSLEELVEHLYEKKRSSTNHIYETELAKTHHNSMPEGRLPLRLVI